MMEKPIKFCFIFAIALVFGIFFVCLVWAGAFSSSVVPSNVNEDVMSLYNFTVSNDAADTNLTAVNVTLPSGFSFIPTSNGTSASDNTFSNTSTVLIWTNSTADGFVLNQTAQYFWFNATAATPGNYNFTVGILDIAGVSNTTNVAVSVNDTTYPTWDEIPSNQTVEYGSAFNYNVNASDNVAVDSYFVDDTANFIINTTGWIKNNTALSLGIYTLNISVNDTSNNINSTVFSVNVSDTIAPYVLYVNSTKADGSYTTGEIINITMIFSEVVTQIGGAPELTLELGATDRKVFYIAGNGTDTLVFNYTVQAGDNTNDLDYNDSWALFIGIGDIYDLAGNDANWTLPAPGAANSLGANKNIVIDTANPSSVALNAPANALNTSSTTIDFNWTAIDNLDGVLTCNLTIGSVVNATVESENGSATNYTVSGFADGLYYWNVTCIDNATNLNTSETRTFTVDTTAPTWDFTPANQAVEYGAAFSYDVNATDLLLDSYAVNDTNFTIDSSGLITNATFLSIGIYNINITVNDTSNNINSSVIAVNVSDTTAPTWDFTPANQNVVVGNAFSYDVNATDLQTITYSIDDTGNFSINSSTGLIANKTALSIGTYPLEINATDASSNVNSADINVTVSAAPTPSSGGGGTRTIVYSPTASEIAVGKSFTIKRGDKIEIIVKNAEHTIKIDKISTSKQSVTVIIMSEPTEVTVNVGETVKVDVDGDGADDLAITLNSVGFTKADLEIKSIVPAEEVMEEVEEAVEEAVEEVPEECAENWQCTEWSECLENRKTRTCTDLNDCGTVLSKPSESQFCISPKLKSNLWLWAAIIAAIIVAAGIAYAIVKKSKQHMHHK